MIPLSFPLLGHNISVAIVTPDKWEHGEDCAGIWIPSVHQIHIYGGLDDSLQMHTFFHELMHAALDMMNHKLARNEAFVDQLAGLLHQALTGAVYAKPKRQKKAVSK